MNNIKRKLFSEIDLTDVFFDSLKEDYPGFSDWFERKSDEYAFVQYDEMENLIGFLYIKYEEGCVNDVNPPIVGSRIMKIGTFKIDSHGTKMGEQFIKTIMDYAVVENVDACYMTIFEKHSPLINLIKTYGFDYWGTKGDDNRTESVYLKSMREKTDDIFRNFPMIDKLGCNKYVLAIRPEFHSRMFPDSILNTENKDLIKDVSYTNSINKIYVCRMSGTAALKNGDIIVLYRMGDPGKYPKYSSVATSICVVDYVKRTNEYNSLEDYYRSIKKYSIFTEYELNKYYGRSDAFVIKMTYNIALNKRITKNDLVKKVGVNENVYWGFFKINDQQFKDIVYLGKVPDNYFY